MVPEQENNIFGFSSSFGSNERFWPFFSNSGNCMLELFEPQYLNSFPPSIIASLDLSEGMVLAVLAGVLTRMSVLRGSVFTFWCVFDSGNTVGTLFM